MKITDLLRTYVRWNIIEPEFFDDRIGTEEEKEEATDDYINSLNNLELLRILDNTQFKLK